MLQKNTFFIAALIGMVASVEAQIPAYKPDSLALLEFNRQMIDEGWPSLWDTTKNVRDWKGVFYDYSTGKVTGLNISGTLFSPQFTTDSLPAAIEILGSLDSLANLGLRNLELKYLPQEITNLQDVNTLALGYNNLSELPDFINQLNDLQYLLLNSNDFTSLPDLSGLTKLEMISLSSNKTLEQFPPSLFQIESLLELDLGYTSVQEIPEEISNLINLQELDVQAASLSSLPESIGDLPNLEELFLSNNQLTELPASINKLSKLARLDVSRNQLTHLPEEMSGMVALWQLDFSENFMTAFPVSIVSLPLLRQITGDRNQMEGSIPPGIFNINNLQLLVEGNNLSGRLAIKSNKIPEQLNIKNNRFTFRDIIEHYHEPNTSDVDFQPQQKIGSYRTYEPETGDVLDIYIDNYILADGDSFQWYWSDNISLGGAIGISNKDSLKIDPYDPSLHAGIYYCEVTNPALPDLSLRSNAIRVIGNDAPPTLTYRNIVFRSGNIPYLVVTANDDFTPKEELVYQFPSETEHFILKKDTVYDRSWAKFIYPKDLAAYSADTITINVTDENNHSASGRLTIKMLPPGNELPVINLDTVYTNIYNDNTLPCTPGAPGCVAFYPFAATTYLKYFVTDDYTDVDHLTFKILEADPGSGSINSKVYMPLIARPDGVTLDATILAYQDTTVTVTLEVTDSEEGVAQKSIRFIGKGIEPNKNPEIESIPYQQIVKGAIRFPVLNLNEFATDDYVPGHLFLWEVAWLPSLTGSLKDSLLAVEPTFLDSAYSTELTLYVSEKTNYNRKSSATISFHIIDSLELEGTVKSSANKPLANVEIKGFDEPVFTSSQGSYEAHVLPGWRGKIYPVLIDYEFTPDTIAFENLQASKSDQDFVGLYVGNYTISGTVTTAGDEPLNVVLLEGFPDKVFSDDRGRYAVKVPYNWSGQVTPKSDGYAFEPESRMYEELTGNLSVEDYQGIQIITAIADEPETQHFKVYPNPAQDKVIFSIDDLSFTEGYIDIYNSAGKHYTDIPLIPGVKNYYWRVGKGHKIVVGMYHAKLSVEGEIVKTIKFIIE